MSGEPQLYRINPETRQSDRIEEVEFARLGLRERQDIQEWVAANPGILGDDLLIISKEFNRFDRTNERLDLLAVDLDGKLVVIELKRDDSGPDVHWQAIKYASYFQRATAESIIKMTAEYWKESEDDADTRLSEHLEAGDLGALNNDQRIILASHRFAPEVTSAALWLNQKAHDLITCVKLTPYQDTQTGALYVQASTIIPVPGIDEYLIGVDGNTSSESIRPPGSWGARLREGRARNRNDEVTHFLRRVGELATDGLPEHVKPDRTSKTARGSIGWRHYALWYSRPPWRDGWLRYLLTLSPHGEAGEYHAQVWLRVDQRHHLKDDLDNIDIRAGQERSRAGIRVTIGIGMLDDDFASKFAEISRALIEQITPLVDEFENETGDEDVPSP